MTDQLLQILHDVAERLAENTIGVVALLAIVVTIKEDIKYWINSKRKKK